MNGSQEVEQMLLTISEASKLMGLSRAKVYQLISQPEKGLPIIRIGRSVRISVASLKKWIEERENEQQSV